MKKGWAIALALMLLAGVSAHAAELGVQVISNEPVTAETVSMDDMKIDMPLDVYGYGTLKLTGFATQNVLRKYKKDSNSATDIGSGNEADFVVLKMDITNTTNAAKSYLSDVEVKAVFQDSFEFAGWAYQYNWDRSNGDKRYSAEIVLHEDDNFAINPWYIGHYCFGCTLPNTVIESKAPLRLEIKIGGNELTYHIRK